MRILRNIIITLLLLALGAISVVGVMVEMPQILGWTPTRVNQLGHSFIEVMRPRQGLLWMWVTLTGCCLLVLLMTVFRRRKPMRIEVQMGGGRVVILDSAIKRYIRTALAELSDVTVKRINLRETRTGISTEIYADVKTEENLPVLERRMIQRVRAALAEDLGITSISDVHVYIRDFEVSGRTPGGHRHNERESLQVADNVPGGATGQFDQGPMPVNPPAAEQKDATFFTPKPTGARPNPTPSRGNVVLPILADEAAAPVIEALPAPATADPTDQVVPEPKPKRRGLFGLGRPAADEPPAEETAEHGSPNPAADQEISYNPATGTEVAPSADVPPTEAEAAPHGDALTSTLEPSPEESQENRS